MTLKSPYIPLPYIPNQANYSALHSVPLYMNQINTAILRVTTGDDALSIAMTLHPFPREP